MPPNASAYDMKSRLLRPRSVTLLDMAASFLLPLMFYRFIPDIQFSTTMMGGEAPAEKFGASSTRNRRPPGVTS